MKTVLFTFVLILLLPYNASAYLDSLDYALINAVKTCDYARVNAAVKTVPDINVADASGKTALHHAVVCANPEIVSLLLLHHANPLLEDKQGMTPLDYAMLFEQAAIIEILLNRQMPTGVQAM